MLPFEKVHREIVEKLDYKSDGALGSDPEKRSIKQLLDYGVINLNKPAGPTSHQISDYVKKILNLEKAGHSGTLDPNVTGVLPIALGKSTRIVQVLLSAGKEYVCLMHLHDDYKEEFIREKLNEMIGKIKQLPPVKSAVKRQIRTREIYYIEVLEIDGRDVLFKIGCQAGTYIRKYCFDFGKLIGSGAHMQELVRTKAGPFTDNNWTTMHDLKDAFELYKEGDESEIRKIIIPVERAVDHLSKVWVKDNCVDTLCHGAQLSLPGVVRFHDDINIGDYVAVMTMKNELVCIGKAVMNAINMKLQDRGIVLNEIKVFMERGTYKLRA